MYIFEKTSDVNGSNVNRVAGRGNPGQFSLPVTPHRRSFHGGKLAYPPKPSPRQQVPASILDSQIFNHGPNLLAFLPKFD